jgi:hypothetical protein
MQALTAKHNSYAEVVFRPLKVVPPYQTAVLLPVYSRHGSSRSITDSEHLSSFCSTSGVIDSLFALRDAARVYRHVQKHPELFSLLLRARAEAYWLFGPKARVLLRMEEDPEGEFEPRLLVLIKTDAPAIHALRLLDTLDDRWWLSVSPDSRTLMKIDVEYV